MQMVAIENKLEQAYYYYFLMLDMLIFRIVDVNEMWDIIIFDCFSLSLFHFQIQGYKVLHHHLRSKYNAIVGGIIQLL